MKKKNERNAFSQRHLWFLHQKLRVENVNVFID